MLKIHKKFSILSLIIGALTFALVACDDGGSGGGGNNNNNNNFTGFQNGVHHKHLFYSNSPLIGSKSAFRTLLEQYGSCGFSCNKFDDEGSVSVDVSFERKKLPTNGMITIIVDAGFWGSTRAQIPGRFDHRNNSSEIAFFDQRAFDFNLGVFLLTDTLDTSGFNMEIRVDGSTDSHVWQDALTVGAQVQRSYQGNGGDLNQHCYYNPQDPACTRLPF